MLKFKEKWDMIGLFCICSDYLNNQTESEAIRLIERIEGYKKKYCEVV